VQWEGCSGPITNALARRRRGHGNWWKETAARAQPWQSMLRPSDSSGQLRWLNDPCARKEAVGPSAANRERQSGAAQVKERGGGMADVPASGLAGCSS
jgi:hypothetical protein